MCGALDRGLALFDLEWGNIQAGQAWAAAHVEDDDMAAKVCRGYADVGLYCLNLRRHPYEVINRPEAAVSARSPSEKSRA